MRRTAVSGTRPRRGCGARHAYCPDVKRHPYGLDPRHIEEYRNDILEHHYNPLPFDADDIPQLVELMGHDKKNSAYGLPSFVLLSAPGEPVAGIAVEPEDIASILSKQLQPRASR